MRYTDLLRRLHTLGVVEVGKQISSEGAIAFLGRPEAIAFPQAPDLLPVFLDGDDPEMHPEVVAAIARRFTPDGELPPAPPAPKPN